MIINNSTLTQIALLLSLCLASLAQAGETASQTFYIGEGTVLESVCPEAIGFSQYAQKPQAANGFHQKANKVLNWFAKAFKPMQLERREYDQGFQYNTDTAGDGVHLTAEYRF